jgi:hypothetical protein
MIFILEGRMFSTKSLLVIIFILGSAVTLKAGVYYGAGLNSTVFLTDVAVP